jgi:hypothetical protein
LNIILTAILATSGFILLIEEKLGEENRMLALVGLHLLVHGLVLLNLSV